MRVDQGVPGEDAAERSALVREVMEGAPIEAQVQMELARGGEKFLREIDTRDISVPVVEEIGPVPRPASGIQQPTGGRVSPGCYRLLVAGSIWEMSPAISRYSAARESYAAATSASRTVRPLIGT